MSLLQDVLEKIPDEEVVGAGMYEITVNSFKQKKSKRGNEMYEVVFELRDYPNAKPIFDYFPLPTEDMAERSANSIKRRFKSFVEAFDFDSSVPLGETFPEAIIGATGWAQLTVEESEQYGESNKITRYMINN